MISADISCESCEASEIVEDEHKGVTVMKCAGCDEIKYRPMD